MLKCNVSFLRWFVGHSPLARGEARPGFKGTHSIHLTAAAATNLVESRVVVLYNAAHLPNAKEKGRTGSHYLTVIGYIAREQLFIDATTTSVACHFFLMRYTWRRERDIGSAWQIGSTDLPFTAYHFTQLPICIDCRWRM